MNHLAMDPAVSAENAARFQQPLGKPSGFPTVSTATTTTRYSRCPPKRDRSGPFRSLGEHKKQMNARSS